MKDKTMLWQDYPKAAHIISLGAGVQSSTLGEMAAAGEISPMPLAAVFADTGSEPVSVYRWLDWLEKRLPFPVYRVNAGRLEDKEVLIRRSKKSGKLYRSNKIPAYTVEMRTISCPSCDGGADGPDCYECKGRGRVEQEHRGMLHRMCTLDFKIKPVLRKLKELAGVPRGCKDIRVVQWIGISTDEALRVKDSPVPWATNRYPLLEMKKSRNDCLQYFEERGFPKPPKSACVYCPYHNDQEWKRLRDEEPEEFQRAVEFERRMQEAATKSEVSSSVPWLHRSCVPLDKVEFKDGKQLNLFQQECTGMCGN